MPWARNHASPPPGLFTYAAVWAPDSPAQMAPCESMAELHLARLISTCHAVLNHAAAVCIPLKRPPADNHRCGHSIHA